MELAAASAEMKANDAQTVVDGAKISMDHARAVSSAADEDASKKETAYTTARDAKSDDHNILSLLRVYYDARRIAYDNLFAYRKAGVNVADTESTLAMLEADKARAHVAVIAERLSNTAISRDARSELRAEYVTATSAVTKMDEARAAASDNVALANRNCAEAIQTQKVHTDELLACIQALESAIATKTSRPQGGLQASVSMPVAVPSTVGTGDPIATRLAALQEEERKADAEVEKAEGMHTAVKRRLKSITGSPARERCELDIAVAALDIDTKRVALRTIKRDICALGGPGSSAKLERELVQAISNQRSRQTDVDSATSAFADAEACIPGTPHGGAGPATGASATGAGSASATGSPVSVPSGVASVTAGISGAVGVPPASAPTASSTASPTGTPTAPNTRGGATKKRR